jgi:hypothetical protein
MDTGLDAALTRYAQFFEELSYDTVEGFRDLAAPNVRYRDPFMDARGIDEVTARMRKWFVDLDGLRFQIKGTARDGHQAFALWTMSFRIRRSPNRDWKVDGASSFVFDEGGRVKDHFDFWDASPLLEAFPVLGQVVSLVKKLASG